MERFYLTKPSPRPFFIGEGTLLTGNVNYLTTPAKFAIIGL